MSDNLDRLRQLLEVTEVIRRHALPKELSGGIIISDWEGAIIHCEAGAAEAFGYEPQELNGQSLDVLMPERYRPYHAEGFRRLRKTGQSRLAGKALSLVGLAKNGTEFPLAIALDVAELSSGERVVVGQVLVMPGLKLDRSVLIAVESGRGRSTENG